MSSGLAIRLLAASDAVPASDAAMPDRQRRTPPHGDPLAAAAAGCEWCRREEPCHCGPGRCVCSCGRCMAGRRPTVEWFWHDAPRPAIFDILENRVDGQLTEEQFWRNARAELRRKGVSVQIGPILVPDDVDRHEWLTDARAADNGMGC